jgi:hypothetical protein
MAERKVLNKYYPPDFDPTKLRRFEKKTVRRMCNVRMMLPMSVRCYTCQNYMYIGTKFNMKVETVKDEDYLGIKVYRFYFKCTQCYAEITFKTDPKNHDYVSEWGAKRNHETWKDMLMAEEEFKEIKQSEMKDDAMKSLEHRTYDSKREMDILDALDQVKSLNRRQAQINYDDLIEKAVRGKDKEDLKLQEEIAEKDAKEKFQKMRQRRIEDYNIIENEKNDKIDENSNLSQNYIEINSIEDKEKNNSHSIDFLNKKHQRENDDNTDKKQENIFLKSQDISDSESEKSEDDKKFSNLISGNSLSKNNLGGLSNSLKLKIKSSSQNSQNSNNTFKNDSNVLKINPIGITSKPLVQNKSNGITKSLTNNFNFKKPTSALNLLSAYDDQSE